MSRYALRAAALHRIRATGWVNHAAQSANRHPSLIQGVSLADLIYFPFIVSPCGCFVNAPNVIEHRIAVTQNIGKRWLNPSRVSRADAYANLGITRETQILDQHEGRNDDGSYGGGAKHFGSSSEATA